MYLNKILGHKISRIDLTSILLSGFCIDLDMKREILVFSVSDGISDRLASPVVTERRG